MVNGRLDNSSPHDVEVSLVAQTTSINNVVAFKSCHCFHSNIGTKTFDARYQTNHSTLNAKDVVPFQLCFMHIPSLMRALKGYYINNDRFTF